MKRSKPDRARAQSRLRRGRSVHGPFCDCPGAIGPCPGGWLYSVRRYAPKAMLRSGSRRPKRSPTMGLARPRWLSLRRAATRVALVIAAMLTFVAALSDILVDWTWFSALGYVDVFWIVLTAKVALFATVLVASATVVLANGW